MSNKIVKIIIFAVAGIGCLFSLWFAMSFDDNRKDLYYEIGTMKDNNPQVIDDFKTVTLDQLPGFVEKNNNTLDELNANLKAEQLQKDIFYTFLVQLKDLTAENFDEYKAGFAQSSAILFAKADQSANFIDGFNKVTKYENLAGYIRSLEAEYNTVKQNYLLQKEYVAAFGKFNARAKTITEVVSDSKRDHDFEQLKSDASKVTTETVTINAATIFFYIVLIMAIVLTVAFMLYQLATNIKTSYKALLAVLAIVVVFIIGYIGSSGELTASAIKEGLSSSDVKMIGAGAITFYVLLFGAIASIFLSFFINRFKKS